MAKKPLHPLIQEAVEEAILDGQDIEQLALQANVPPADLRERIRRKIRERHGLDSTAPPPHRESRPKAASKRTGKTVVERQRHCIAAIYALERKGVSGPETGRIYETMASAGHDMGKTPKTRGSAMSAILGSLEGRGWLRIEKRGPEGQERKLSYLTDMGRTFARQDSDLVARYEKITVKDHELEH